MAWEKVSNDKLNRARVLARDLQDALDDLNQSAPNHNERGKFFRLGRTVDEIANDLEKIIKVKAMYAKQGN